MTDCQAITVSGHKTAVASNPSPAITSRAAVAQMLAAVVKPSTTCFVARTIIAPAPRKPIPCRIHCSTRDMSSIRMPLCNEPMTNRAAPTATSIWVLTPALLPLSSRSYPRIPPSTAASTRRTVMSNGRHVGYVRKFADDSRPDLFSHGIFFMPVPKNGDGSQMPWTNMAN